VFCYKLLTLRFNLVANRFKLMNTTLCDTQAITLSRFQNIAEVPNHSPTACHR